MKTARFSRIVAECGRPRVHLLLVSPERDPALRRLARAGRILTVHQAPRGGRKDYGTVGLLRTRHAQLLVFPRSLSRHAAQRIVGIDYDLLAEPAGRGGPVPRAPDDRRPRRAPAPVHRRQAPSAPPPPTWPEVRREVRAVSRLLGRRGPAAVRARLDRLAARLESAPDPS